MEDCEVLLFQYLASALGVAGSIKLRDVGSLLHGSVAAVAQTVGLPIQAFSPIE